MMDSKLEHGQVLVPTDHNREAQEMDMGTDQ